MKPATAANSIAKVVRLTPADSLLELDRSDVINLFKQSGVVLFRDFEVDSTLFCEFTNQYCEHFGRIGGTLRSSASNDGSLFEVTEGTGELEFHSELAHSPCSPDIIWFWCVKPADAGGETQLLDGIEFAHALDRAKLNWLEEKSLEYSHRMPEIMWKSFFGVETRQECERYLSAAEGVREVSFNKGDVLTFKYVVPALRRTRFGGVNAFVNSILILTQRHDHIENDRPVTFSVDNEDERSFSMTVAFEGGSKISDFIIDKIRQMAHQLSFSYELRENEILMIDNTRFQHARRSFQGPRLIFSRYARAAFT